MSDESTAFESGWDYARFRERLQSGHRFFRTAADDAFFRALASAANDRVSSLPKDKVLARAQLGCDIENRSIYDEEVEVIVEHEIPYSLERMKPLRIGKTAGRLHPVGKSVLYLSAAIETSIAEVRPWVGARVSVARFEITRDLKIVDCRDDKHLLGFHMDRDDTPSERADIVWSWINRDLASPVDPSEPHINYLHTQIIGEFLHLQGYDGIAFKSSLHAGGVNFALFDLDAAAPKTCALYRVKTVTYASEPAHD